MKAVIVEKFGEPDVLKVKEVDKPSINSSQVLIHVKATSVNFADIKARYGQYHGAGQPPFIPGLDVAGIIEEVGADVKHLKVGQKVIAFPQGGSYAEYVVADQMLTYVIPEDLPFVIAAASPVVSITSYKLLADIAALKKGETVLIHAAAGGIGTTAIQLAKLLGASMVIGTVGSEKKIEAAKSAGADHVVICEENFSQKINDITNGKGVDIILDSLAGWVTAENLKCLALYGRLAVFGNASGESGLTKTNDLHASCRSILGFSLGTTIKNRPELLIEAAKNVIELLSKGHLSIKIGETLPIEEASRAHKYIESRQSTGKIVLTL